MNDNTYTLQPAIPFNYYDEPRQGYYIPDWDLDEELVLTHMVPNVDDLGEAYKWLSKIAWQVRRIEAKRFDIPLMQVSWRRCLLLAAIINDKHKGMNSWLVAGIKQRAWMGRSVLTWC